MKDITFEEGKQIQLSILREVDSFCQNKGLTYYMSYGTLLGAVRHKGFIPWDDDIDIAMPYPDFIKFCSSFGDDVYKVHHWIRTPLFHCNYAKVEDGRTILKEEITSSYEMGVNIDVAPIIGLPENKQDAVHYFRRIDFIRGLLRIKKMKLRRGRQAYKQLTVLGGRILLAPFSYKTINHCLDRLCARYPFNHSHYVICVGSFNSEKEIFEKEKLGKKIKLPFEQDEFCAPEGYDLWLKQIFGDYMQLPPEKDRVTHHKFLMYWK